MADISKYTFGYKEVVEALIKKQDLHEGVWALDVNFGLRATNFGTSESDLAPTAIIPVLGIGLTKQDRENNVSVDAAKVNPRLPIPRSRSKNN
jgi:hypothetical protein